MRKYCCKSGDISFESNNSAGGISKVSTTTNRVALENSMHNLH
jgi:hypothetical protein